MLRKKKKNAKVIEFTNIVALLRGESIQIFSHSFSITIG